MTRTRVKICGITRAEDALQAAELGADALGLNFHPPSPRAVQPAAIREIVGRLPAFVTVVGLFVDPAPAQVQRVLDSGLIQCLQFHGNETADFCQSFGVPFLKAVRVRDLDVARQAIAPFRGNCSLILDAYVKGTAGGTGESFDWAIARTLVEEGVNPIILAGGLTPDNVMAAIEQVKPYGVDLCSGVEVSPGIKDVNKMRRFFELVNGSR